MTSISSHPEMSDEIGDAQTMPPRIGNNLRPGRRRKGTVEHHESRYLSQYARFGRFEFASARFPSHSTATHIGKMSEANSSAISQKSFRNSEQIIQYNKMNYFSRHNHRFALTSSGAGSPSRSIVFIAKRFFETDNQQQQPCCYIGDPRTRTRIVPSPSDSVKN